MPDDDLFNSLEERLRDDARGLLGETPPTPLIADLLDTFVRRRRRRRVVQSLGVASLALLLGVACVRWFPWQTGDDKPRPVAGVERPESPSPPAFEPRPPIVVRVSRGSPTLRPGSVAIGVWVARPGAAGKTELVPGLYVPEQSEPLDSRDWSQAERLAVTRLLGPDAIPSRHKTI